MQLCSSDSFYKTHCLVNKKNELSCFYNNISQSRHYVVWSMLVKFLNKYAWLKPVIWCVAGLIVFFALRHWHCMLDFFNLFNTQDVGVVLTKLIDIDIVAGQFYFTHTIPASDLIFLTNTQIQNIVENNQLVILNSFHNGHLSDIQMYIDDIKQFRAHIASRDCNIFNCIKPIHNILYELCCNKIVVPSNINSPMSIAYYKLDTLVRIHDNYYFFKLAS